MRERGGVCFSDINDNPPFLMESILAEVEEGRAPRASGVYVTTISARDYDDPTTPNGQLDWSITANKLLNDTPLFRISDDGKIFLMASRRLAFGGSSRRPLL